MTHRVAIFNVTLFGMGSGILVGVAVCIAVFLICWISLIVVSFKESFASGVIAILIVGLFLHVDFWEVLLDFDFDERRDRAWWLRFGMLISFVVTLVLCVVALIQAMA